jgi:sugar lactone lactonase YvrE
MRRLLPIGLLTSLISCLLAGCGAGDLAPSSPLAVAAGQLHGVVHGGIQPVVGAKVYLLEATTTGYGAASKSLLTSATGSTADSIGYSVKSGADGQFTITGDYNCDASSVVYLLALGGNTGAGTNSSSGFMSTLGICPSVAPFTFAATVPDLYISEVSTVATAYALAGFATDATHIATSGNPLGIQGVQNAAGNFTNLVDVATGAALSVMPTNSTGVVPTATLNTLANILAACVNSTDASPANCTTLFSNTLSGGSTGTKPTDTATAAINLAHNLWVSDARVTALYNLQAASGAPFLPDLTSQPTDFAVGLTMQVPDGNYIIAIAGDGSAWVSSGNSMVRFNARGTQLNTISLGFSPQNIAIDAQGRGWIDSDYALSAYTAAGTALAGSPFTQPGISTKGSFKQLAFDQNGNVWVGDENSIYIFTSTGAAASFSPISYSGSNPNGFAVDSSGVMWVNDGDEYLYSYTSAGASTSTASYSCDTNPVVTAFDSNNNAWIATLGGICKVSESGTVATGFPVEGIASSRLVTSVALDGANQVWGVSTAFIHLANDGTVLNPSSGNGSTYTSTGYSVQGVALDGSGNVWANYTATDTVIELIGAATPVVTPIVANLLSPYGSSAVNKP